MENSKPEMLIPFDWKQESISLVDLMSEQEKVMGQTEQREMLVFLRGVAFGRMLNKFTPAQNTGQQARSSA